LGKLSFCSIAHKIFDFLGPKMLCIFRHKEIPFRHYEKIGISCARNTRYFFALLRNALF
jgi:hypothetical protein